VQRTDTIGRIIPAGRVAKERLRTGGRVVEAGGVVCQRRSTGGGVLVAGCVAKERERSIGRRWYCSKALQRRWPYFGLRCSEGASQLRWPY